jgi:hypothetical protein
MKTMMKWKDFIGPGWHTLAVQTITEIEKNGGWIVQVKEKFGGLRIYCQGGDMDAIDTIVRQAEDTASHICEECGEPGRMESHNGWYKTYCEKHHKEIV